MRSPASSVKEAKRPTKLTPVSNTRVQVYEQFRIYLFVIVIVFL